MFYFMVNLEVFEISIVFVLSKISIFSIHSQLSQKSENTENSEKSDRRHFCRVFGFTNGKTNFFHRKTNPL